MKRGLLIAALPLMLGGCLPILPPAIQLASTGLSGLAFLATGKSTTDHLISAAVDEDCSLLRVAFGDEPCHEYAKAQDKPLTELVAYYPGDGDDWIDQKSIPKGTVSGKTILTIDAGGDPDVVNPDFWPGVKESETLLVQKPDTDGRKEKTPNSLSAGLEALKGLNVPAFAPAKVSFEPEPLELKSAPIPADEFSFPVSMEATWAAQPAMVTPVAELPSPDPVAAVVPDQAANSGMTVFPVLRPAREIAGRQASAAVAEAAKPDRLAKAAPAAHDENRALVPRDSLASSQSVPVASPVIMSVRLKGSLWHRMAVRPFYGQDAMDMVSSLEPVSGQRAWVAKVSH